MRRLEAWTRLGLVVWAMVITMARAVRPPNDFAEAHWLLDYRFGFIRRGFAGSLLSLASSTGLSGQSERVIAALAFLAFGLPMLALLWAAARVVCSGADPGVTFAAAAVFASSPFPSWSPTSWAARPSWTARSNASAWRPACSSISPSSPAPRWPSSTAGA
jgi:hypothetical protein